MSPALKQVPSKISKSIMCSVEPAALLHERKPREGGVGRAATQRFVIVANGAAPFLPADAGQSHKCKQSRHVALRLE